MPLCLRIEPGGEKTTDRCPCCGHFSRRIWGYAYADGDPYVAYYVDWTLKYVLDHSANGDLIVGRWGDGTKADNRCAVSLTYRVGDNGAAFIVIDADTRRQGRETLASRFLRHEEVIGTPLAGNVFALLDVV